MESPARILAIIIGPSTGSAAPPSLARISRPDGQSTRKARHYFVALSRNVSPDEGCRAVSAPEQQPLELALTCDLSEEVFDVSSFFRVDWQAWKPGRAAVVALNVQGILEPRNAVLAGKCPCRGSNQLLKFFGSGPLPGFEPLLPRRGKGMEQRKRNPG